MRQHTMAAILVIPRYALDILLAINFKSTPDLQMQC